ncbi:MAG: hypothetical protein WB341_07090 [Terracidiphilus sp.]
MFQSRKPFTNAVPFDPSWKRLCTIGGITALISILTAPAEVVISLLPGVQSALTHTVTVTDWFTLFQNHWLLGLRSFGLLNLAAAILFIPTILAVCSVLWRDSKSYATLAAIVFFVGIAIYIADNRAFPMLVLSRQYASAATDAQRYLLVAAGQAMLAEGQSCSSLLVIEFAFLLVSAAMLKSAAFSKAAACAGMLAGVLMMVLEIAFIPPHGVAMAIAAGGALP